jgi:hypothetical protein
MPVADQGKLRVAQTDIAITNQCSQVTICIEHSNVSHVVRHVRGRTKTSASSKLQSKKKCKLKLSAAIKDGRMFLFSIVTSWQS